MGVPVNGKLAIGEGLGPYTLETAVTRPLREILRWGCVGTMRNGVVGLLVRQGIWAMDTSSDLDGPALICLANHRNEALDSPIS